MTARRPTAWTQLLGPEHRSQSYFLQVLLTKLSINPNLQIIVVDLAQPITVACDTL